MGRKSIPHTIFSLQLSHIMFAKASLVAFVLAAIPALAVKELSLKVVGKWFPSLVPISYDTNDLI